MIVMPSSPWNPEAYLNYASERTQPFIDLLQRTQQLQPAQLLEARTVLDLGCGPGNGMPILRAMHPKAEIIGIDSSAEMLSQAAESTADDTGIRYVHADIRALTLESLGLEQPAELVVSNAALQWLPDHRELLPRIMDLVAPGGALAVQVPGNFSAPSHRLLAEHAARPEYARHIDPDSLLQPTAELTDYMLDVSLPGWTVEAWETRYHHVLQGEDPVFRWISSTAARPVLQSLPASEREQFSAEYKAALREAYPQTRIGTILPFRRLFFIARREG